MGIHNGCPMRVGIIAMSAKPWHLGHHAMICRASDECDWVRVYASLADRRRAGEKVPVLGSDMKLIWDELIIPGLPFNVEVIFGGSPVGNVWRDLGSDRSNRDEYVIYAGAADLADSFTDKLLMQYCGHLMEHGLIKREATERLASGSEMRAMLARGDQAGFISQLPSSIDRQRVWDILSATARSPPRVKTTTGARRARKNSSSSANGPK